MKVENKFEHSICALTIEIYTIRNVCPTFMQCLMGIDTWKFEATLKALCIPLSNLIRSFAFLDLYYQQLNDAFAFKHWRCQWAKSHLSKVKRLEWQSAHHNRKHTSVNNRYLGLIGRLGLGQRETLNEWKCFWWKSWMKEVRQITNLGIFWFYTPRYK